MARMNRWKDWYEQGKRDLEGVGLRRIISSGSVKAVYLDRKKALQRIREVSAQAAGKFPEIMEIRLFGSLAKGEETGLSDIDIFLLVESAEKNPIERMKPYFMFFSEKLEIALDLIVSTEGEKASFKDMLADSLLLYSRD